MSKRERFNLHPEEFMLKCGVCGKEFLPTSYDQYKNLVCKAKKYHRMFYCSDKCKSISKGTKTLKCEYCGKEFNVGKYEIEHRNHHFCSKDCWIKYQQENSKTSKRYAICSFCGKEYHIGKANFGKYCSLKCQHNDIIKKIDTQIEQGISVSHRMLRNYLLRHYNKCMNPKCKWDWDNNSENNPVLELHHIDGVHTNNTLENCVLLCPNCHALTDNYKYKKKHKSTRTYRKNYYK